MWGITLALTLLALGIAYHTGRAEPTFLHSWPQTLCFFALFLAADATVLHLEVRRQSLVVSMGEIPLLLALFYLPPLGILIVRLLAAALVQGYRRPGLTKLLFNLASTSASAAVAILVFTEIDEHPVDSLRTWFVVLLAVVAMNLTGTVAVAGAITLVQGRPAPGQLLRNGISAFVVSLINATAGLLILLILRSTTWGVILLIGLGVVFVLSYRAYARFLHQHKSLTELYDLTHELGEARREGTLVDVLLTRTRELLSAESATLWLPALGRHPEVLLTARMDDTGLLDRPSTPAVLRNHAVKEGVTVAVGPRMGPENLRAELRTAGGKDAIVVPLRSGTAVVGCLEVANRLGDRLRFGIEDIRLLETLAAHGAVAVENSRLVDRLRFDAYHDQLTKLPNRRRLSSALEEAVRVRAPGEAVAVLIFDVDGLRDVNDSLGHGAGDKLLIEVGRRLALHAPASALVSRIGSDEFGVSLRIANGEAAVALAGEMRAALQEPFSLGTLTLDVNAAVGIALHPDHGTEPETLLQRADVATYAAKSINSGIQIFNLGLESHSVRRLGLAGDLRRALDTGEIEVYFQPKIAISRRELVGVECLARWEHPAHGSVAPEDFVTVAEHTGQLGRLTEVVLREGLRHCRQWSDEGRPLGVAVNLSPRTLMDPEFPARVSALLDEYGVSPGRLTLEITEDGMVGETDRPLPTLRRLHDIGIRLSVDDFGTGYSSLSYLRRLPVHEVKVDRTFVQGMATDPGDYAIVRAVVDLSRHFGLEVVAEGVESELTLSQLEEMGCDVGQGFFFSRPLPSERLETWFAARTELTPSGSGGVRRLRVVP